MIRPQFLTACGLILVIFGSIGVFTFLTREDPIPAAFAGGLALLGVLMAVGGFLKQPPK